MLSWMCFRTCVSSIWCLMGLMPEVGQWGQLVNWLPLVRPSQSPVWTVKGFLCSENDTETRNTSIWLNSNPTCMGPASTRLFINMFFSCIYRLKRTWKIAYRGGTPCCLYASGHQWASDERVPFGERYSFRALERSNALRQDASCATTKARFMDPPGTLRVCGRGQGG